MPSDANPDSAAIGFTSARELVRAYSERRLGAVEVARALLDRIERFNPGLNAFYLVCEDALEQARQAQVQIDAGRAGPLCGVPVVLKDHTLVKGLPAPYGSLANAGSIAAEDSIIWERLRAAGAVLLGKTIMPAYGHMGVTHSYLHGITRNPWNPAHTPGGSSGGSAVAVAGGMAPVAIGTDGGGSIRIPSSFSGIYGLKPSLGRVPMYPTIGNSDQLSHGGPMTRTVADAALTLNVLAGPDERDNISLPGPVPDYLDGIDELDPPRTRIAYAPELGFAQVDPEVAAVCRSAVDRLSDVGCRIEEVGAIWDDPSEDFMALFSTNYALRSGADLERDRALLEPTYVAMVEHGLSLSREKVIAAGARRREMVARGRELFERFDVLLLPTVAVLPLKVGTDAPADADGLEPLSWAAHTYTFNLTGYPAASCPAGFAAGNLPVGLQVVGPRFADQMVLSYSRLLEKILPFAEERPPLVA